MQHPRPTTPRRPASNDPAPEPMDPIALTLAVWLGLIVSVNGLVRMSDNAARQATFAQYAYKSESRPPEPAPAEDFRAIQLRLAAFGN